MILITPMFYRQKESKPVLWTWYYLPCSWTQAGEGHLLDQGKARDTKGLINYCTQWSLLPTSLDFDLHIQVILSFTPYPLFHWYLQSKEIFIKSEYEMLKLSI